MAMHVTLHSMPMVDIPPMLHRPTPPFHPSDFSGIDFVSMPCQPSCMRPSLAVMAINAIP